MLYNVACRGGPRHVFGHFWGETTSCRQFSGTSRAKSGEPGLWFQWFTWSDMILHDSPWLHLIGLELKRQDPSWFCTIHLGRSSPELFTWHRLGPSFVVPTCHPVMVVHGHYRPFLCLNSTLRSPRTLETVEEISPQNPWMHEFQDRKRASIRGRVRLCIQSACVQNVQVGELRNRCPMHASVSTSFPIKFLQRKGFEEASPSGSHRGRGAELPLNPWLAKRGSGGIRFCAQETLCKFPIP